MSKLECAHCGNKVNPKNYLTMTMYNDTKISISFCSKQCFFDFVEKDLKPLFDKDTMDNIYPKHKLN